MSLTDRDRRRLNRAMPIANVVKLGDLLYELQQNSGGVVDAYTKAESDDRFQAKGNYATTTQLNDKADKTELTSKADQSFVESEIARLEAMIETLGGGGA